MRTVIMDLSTIPVSSTEVVNLSADNAPMAADAPVRRRILAVSEGTHNRISFTGPEIEKMVTGCVNLKSERNLAYVPAPIVIGHTDNPMMKIGSTVNIWYDPARKAAIADIDLWQDTSMQRDLVKLIKRDPDNTFFSVRVIGQMDSNNKIHDMKLIHIANVIQPADSNARLIESSSSNETPKVETNLSEDGETKELRPDEIQESGVTPVQDGKQEDARDEVPEETPEEEAGKEGNNFVPDNPESYDIVDEDWTAPVVDNDNPSLFAFVGDISDVSTYKLPHHNADGDLIIDGLSEAMQGIGQAGIPEEFIEAVTAHLQAHQDEVNEAVGSEDDGNVEVVEGNLSDSDNGLYSYPKNLTDMTDDQSQQIIELQRINEMLVADLEEAQRALGTAEAEIEGLRDQVDVAEEKGQLIAEIKSLNLEVDEEFIQSMTVEQLQKYVEQLKNFAQRAQEKIDQAVKQAAPEEPAAPPMDAPAPPAAPPMPEEEKPMSLSDRFLTGRAKVDLCADGTTPADAALSLFGPVTKFTGR